jgi:hypothetical protein
MEVDAPVGMSFAHGFWRIPSIIPIQYSPRTFCHPRGLTSMGKETICRKNPALPNLRQCLIRFHAGIVFYLFREVFRPIQNPWFGSVLSLS